MRKRNSYQKKTRGSYGQYNDLARPVARLHHYEHPDQGQRNRIGGNDRRSAYQQAIDQPKDNTQPECQQHCVRKIVATPGAPCFVDLGNKRNGRQCASDKAEKTDHEYLILTRTWRGESQDHKHDSCASHVVEKRHETKIHVQLLVAMK